MCDERVISSSDYTARVRNVSRNFPDCADIVLDLKNWFEENGLGGSRVNVVAVNLCYDCGEKIALVKEVE